MATIGNEKKRPSFIGFIQAWEWREGVRLLIRIIEEGGEGQEKMPRRFSSQANSTESIDLNRKKPDYKQAGVSEYKKASAHLADERLCLTGAVPELTVVDETLRGLNDDFLSLTNCGETT